VLTSIKSETGDASQISLNFTRDASHRLALPPLAISGPMLPSSTSDYTPSVLAQIGKRKIDQAELTPSENTKRNRTYKLCDECREIDFDKVLNLGSQNLNGEGIFIQKVGKRFRQPISTGCPLCQMLVASRVPFEDIGGKYEDVVEDELWAFHLLGTMGFIDLRSPQYHEYRNANQLQYLAVVPSGWKINMLNQQAHLHQNGCPVVYRENSLKPNIFAVRPVSCRFDPSLVASWLQYCSQRHKKLCSKNTPQVDRLKLIDCESLTLENAHDQAVYVALSYVWGSSDGDSETQRRKLWIDKSRLPVDLPPVVLDAVKVTKTLGFRYLWIDKFCIDQDDEDMKHDQIQQMSSIYGNAELTIIAAAGTNENHGLPGVRSTARLAQPTAEIGDIKIISTMRDPHTSIRSSKYSTRGWTFQEAILSRRRLVFTDEQVYFECNAMNCYESIFSSLDKVHTKDKSRQRALMRAGMFGRRDGDCFGRLDMNSIKVYHVYLRYLSAIEDYSARELSYDTDSFNAFIGIARKFESVRNRILEVWGVPYPPSLRTDEVCSYFAVGLAWAHVRGCWDTIEKPRRRTDFPSWSWTGWAGQVAYPGHKRSGDDKIWFTTELKSIDFEFDSGKKLGFAQLTDPNFIMTVRALSPRVLVLRAHVMPANAFSYDHLTGLWRFFNFPAQLSLSQGPDSPTQFFEELQKGDRWHCIYIGHDIDFVVAMVLGSRNGIVSRAGLFRIKVYYRVMNKVWKPEGVGWTKFRIE
jgi:hypothetical protein